ncbi:hypothetical protein CEUSTIGMA_g3672.t1 [Chlamydomonas eustigma]|uniref:Bardet-Biedl syndrome 7 protein homolog n=1 Tax=Chlamydomonas eustigma TaxID=1157962 RepID=A0A250WZG3_9CHLO|nr:hypothetical protein CEUSTIGMA_g3672.t1 [Chlamydomonas eustigma]|eukprot:GAX76228.1 hypothetical protein CEUSTIGMA_g3672.t1 [Chlamydomonas eustigma]
MELELRRHDLVQTASCARGTLAVLPVGEDKKTQKVAVGDLSGVIQSFGVKKGEIGLQFKTLPSNQKVTSLSLGKGKLQRDRIFVAAGNNIVGISRKGKEFFKFNTQITETISKVDVADKNIWSSGEYIHNMYIEGKDHAFYLCPDRINHAEVMPLISPNDYLPALACQDRHIRVLNGAECILDIPTTATPTTLLFSLESHDLRGRFPDAKELLYSTDTGTLVQLLCDKDATRQGFVLQNPSKFGAIKAIYTGIDFTKTGSNNIVVSREDGRMEIYDVDDSGQLQQVYMAKLTESINSIDGGFVTSVNSQELVLQTFTGKVIAYSPPGAGMLVDHVDKKGNKIMVSEDEDRKAGYKAQVARLKKEMEEIRAELMQEKQKFDKGMGSNALLAASAPFTVQDRCYLEADEACYVLSLESAMPIFAAAIQCNITLQLLDVPSNVAIMSRSPPDPENGNLTLATYRCQDSTSRLSVKFKVREGTGGILQAFVIPNISPKTCVSVSHKIRPLCLHSRINQMDSSRPTNELVVTGTFDLRDIHDWMSNLINEVPHLTSDQDNCLLYYQNTLLSTQLACRFKAGEARFNSDLITTLGIIHEHLMSEATNAKQRVKVSFSPSSASLQHSITLVWPQLEKQRTLKKNFQLLEGLVELKVQDSDVSYLAPEYKALLDHADEIKKAYKEQPQHLDHIAALIKDLYLDFCRLSGINTPKQRLPALEQLLTNTKSTLDQVMDFMLNKL